MCIAKRLNLALVCALAFAALEARDAEAHPIAQGALEIVVFPERVS
jgi:hypothetical protein